MPQLYPKTQAEMEEWISIKRWNPKTKRWEPKAPRRERLARIAERVGEIGGQIPPLQEAIRQRVAPADAHIKPPGGQIATFRTNVPITTSLAETTPLRAITGQNARDALIADLTKAIRGLTGGPTMEEELKTLREERGVPELRKKVGTFEEEIDKARQLLSDLDMRIRRGLAFEEARTIPMPLIRGRQRELEAQASFERGDILAGIEALQRGKERAESALEREEADILTILGLREKEKRQPLEQLKDEITIRKQIRDLTKQEIPNMVSSIYDNAGNLTIITQDPITGAFSTKTLEGIGKKAAEYKSFSTHVDELGNVTIIGIKPDGTTKILGTFEGVGRPKAPTVARGALTISEANKLGLPKSLVGKSEQDAINDLRSASVPRWFREWTETTQRMTFMPSELQRRWDEFRNNVLYATGQEAGAEKETGLENPFRSR